MSCNLYEVIRIELNQTEKSSCIIRTFESKKLAEEFRDKDCPDDYYDHETLIRYVVREF